MNKTDQIYRCIAIDDESHALDLIKLYVEKISFLELVFSSTSPLKAMDWIRANEFDLVFLDIQMKDLTGLQLLDVSNIEAPVILTTAYSEYALESYEYRVVDYLLKPYSFDRFLKAVNNGIEKINAGLKDQAGPSLVAQPSTPTDTHLFIKGDAKNKFHRVAYNDVLYIEGLRNYVHIICESKKIITLQNLKNLAEELPNSKFVRVHKSFIINKDKIDLLEGHMVRIGSKLIPIGQSYRKVFYDQIKG